MFESVAASLLNRILGDYIANLSQEQLSLGIVSGNARLTNLKLKPDALQQLQLPIDVIDGRIGELSMQIPWAALKTRPVVVHIKDVLVLAGPRSKFLYDPVREFERALRKKLSKLETFELVQASADSLNGGSGEDNSNSSHENNKSSDSFLSHLTNRILNNLQVSVENVHVRYEESDFSCGVCIDRVSALSTNAAWEESFIVDGPVYKLASLHSLSIYFDGNHFRGGDASDLAKYFEGLSLRENNKVYLLHPISTNCKLTVQQNYSEELPKILVDLSLPSINLSLQEAQYHKIARVAESFLLLNNSLRYLHVRDQIKQVGLPYAIKCIQSDLRDLYKNRSWEYLRQRRRERKLYVDSFLSRLNARESAQDTKVLEQLEKSLDLVDLRFFRNLARQIKKTQPQSTAAAGGLWSWAGGWFNSNPTATAESSDLAITAEDVSKIYEAIDFSKSATSLNVTVPRDYVTLKVEAKLDSLLLDVFRSASEKVFDISILGFSLELTKRPRNIGFDLAVQDLRVTEGLLADSLYPTIIKKRASTADSHLLQVSYSDYVFSPEFDSKLTLRSEPMEIVYSHASFDLLTSFFSISKESALNQLFIKDAEETISNFANQTKSALERMVQSHKAVELDVKLKAPLLILPISCTDKAESVFALDLGHLECSSQFVQSASREDISGVKIQKGVFNEAFYDLLLLHLSKASILFSYAHEADVAKYDDIVRDIDLSLKIYDTFLPKSFITDMVPTMVFGNAPPLCLYFSDHKYRQFMRLLDIFLPPKYVAPVTASVSEDSSDEFYDSFEGAVNVEALEKTKVEVHLEFETVKVVAFEDDEERKGGRKELIAIDADRLNVDIAVCPKVVDIDVVLKSFNLRNPDLLVIKGTGLEAQESLLSVHVKLVDLDHPLFVKEYDSNKFHIYFGLSSVSLAIRPRTFVSDVQYILRTFVDDDPVRLAAQPFAPVPTKKHLRGSMKQFTLYIRDEDCVRGEAVIVDAQTDIRFTPQQNSVYFRIDEIELWNRKPIPSEAFDCPFLMLKKDSSLEITYDFSDLPLYGDGMCTSFMKFKSGSPIIAYMPQFIEEFLTFINVMKTIKPAPAVRPPEATRMVYKVDLESPVLELPADALNAVDKTSTVERVVDKVCLFFGNVLISNRFQAVKEDPGGHDQFIKGDITDIRAEYHHLGERVCDILEKSTACLQTTQLWQANAQGQPNNKVLVQTQSLNFSVISKPVYTMFLDQLFFLIGTVNQAVMPMVGPPLPFYDAETGRPIHSTHLEWEIARIQLMLLEDGADFAQLQLNDNCFEMDTWSNMVLKIRFPSGEFLVKDYSVPDNAFSQIVEPQNVESQKNTVESQNESQRIAMQPALITYDRAENLEVDLKMSLNGLRIVFFVDLIFKLKSYIVDSWPKPRPPRLGVPPPLQGPPQRTGIELSNSLFLLVEDYKNGESECCKISVDSLMYNFRVNWSMTCKNLWVSLCNMNDLNGTQLEILDSTDAFWIGEIEDSADQKVTLDITPIYCHLSYEDLLFVLSILRQAQARYETHQSTSPSQQVILSTTPFKRQFVFNLSSVRLALIDDISKTNIPFADLHAEHITYSSLNNNNEVSGGGSFSLAANFFNLDNSHWEPLLEQAEMEIVVKPNEGTNACDTVYEFKTPVNFNLSSKFVSAFYDLMQRTFNNNKDDNYVGHKLSAVREVSKPYLITNQTGYAVNVWCDSAEGDNTEMLTIKNGQSAPWAFKNWKDSRKSQNSVFNTLAVHVLDSEWETLRGLPVDRECFYQMELCPPIDPKHPITLVVEILIRERLKEIVLRSPHAIYNHTKFPIEVSVIGAGNSGSTIFTVKPESSYSLPLENLHSGLFRLRPSEQGYEFSEKMIPAKEFFHTGEDDEELFLQERCRNSDAGIAPFYFTLTNVTNADFGRSRRGLIYVEPPLEVVNLLPMDICFRAYDLKAGIDFGGSIPKGASAPFHAVNTSHALGFSLEVDGTDWKSTEVANINSPSGSSDEIDGVLLLTNTAGAELSLCTRIVCTSRCQRCIMIYAPYVILNRSLLDLEFVASSFFLEKCARDVFWSLHSTEGPTDPLLYSFPDMEALKNKVRIRAAQASEWSQPISLDKLGSYIEVNLQNRTSLSWYNLVIKTTNGPSQFACVKLVKIAPLFIVKNDVPSSIFIRAGQESLATEVPENSEMPLHLDPEQFERVRLSLNPIDGNSGGWSAGFGVTSTGRDVIKVKGADGAETLLRVVREISDGTWFIHLSVEKTWPMVLSNTTQFPLSFSQKGVLGRKYLVQANSSRPFAWDEPFNGEKMIQLELQGKMRNINPNEIGQLLPLNIRHPETGERVNLSLSVMAQGPRIIISVSAYDSHSSHYQSSSNISNVGSDDVGFEEKSVASVTSASTTVRIPFLGVSLIQGNGEELVYLSLRGVELRQAVSNLHSTLGLSIGWLQLDNQSVDWQVPIIFYPTNLNRTADDSETEVMPFIKVAVIRLLEEDYGITCYRYFGFLMQECSLELTEEILSRLVGFMPKPALGNSREPMFQAEDAMPPRAQDHLSGRDATSYFEVFQLHPMRVNLSFAKTESQQQAKGIAVYNPLTAALEIVMMTIGHVSDASLKYNALVLENTIINRSTLLRLVVQNYRNETMGQFHRLLGSADMFGNPVGLFENFSSGVTDLFYEPYQGFVSDRPQDIGIGLAKGTASLIRHTVYGLSDSFSKLTGTIGRGFAAATLDKSYQRKRRINRARSKPKHALEGIASGTMQLFSGITSGISGLVEKPVEMTKKDGAAGLLKGVGLGLIGFVTKPIVGVIDLTTSVGEGIRGSADGMELELMSARLPRAIPFDGVLRPYDEYEAQGQSILLAANQLGKRRKDRYVAHLTKLGSDDLGSGLFLTTKRLVLLRLGSKRVIWNMPLSLLQRMSAQGQQVLMIDDLEGNRIMLLVEERLDWFLARYQLLPKIKRIKVSSKKITKH